MGRICPDKEIEPIKVVQQACKDFHLIKCIRCIVLRYGGRLVAHGLRSLGITTLNEQGFNPDAIEAALSHSDDNEIRRAYNRSDYFEQRMKMMEWWSDHIEAAAQGWFSLGGSKGLKVVNS